MYTVEWCNQEGNLEIRFFERLEDAILEEEELQKYSDFVRVTNGLCSLGN